MVDGQAVGFLAGTDILEIRPDLRGKAMGASYGCVAEWFKALVLKSRA
jgi:hypothetical protein